MNKETVLSSLNFRNFYSQYIPSLKINGKSEAMGLCPFHDDHSPSLSVNIESGLYNCFSCGAAGDVFKFYQDHKKVDFLTALKEVAEMQGITDAPKGKVVATFGYENAAGTILYIKERIEPGRNGKSKEFIFKHLNDSNHWITGRGCEAVPYGLPSLIKAKYAVIVEGEAKAKLLTEKFGLIATCFDSGAQSPFRDDYLKYFEGKEKVIILPDNDAPGKAYADKIAAALYGKVGKIKIVELPGLKEAGDIVDWIKIAVNDKTKLLGLIKSTAEWKAEPKPEQPEPKPSGMPLIRLSDLLKEPDELVSWLVDRTLPAGGFSVIAAKPKVGKSTIARNLAFSISKGEPFLGKPVSKGSVIYYALKEKKSEVKKHFHDMGANGTEDIFIYTGGTPVDAIQQIKKVVIETKPVLIIIDPLFRLTKIKDGNDYAQVTMALEPLLRLARDTGTHILCVHHSGKGDRQGGDSVLGSTAIFGSVDSLLIMKRLENYRTISSIQRYGDDLPETTLHFDKDSRTVEIGKLKQEEDIDGLKKAILEFLSSQSEPVVRPVIMEAVEGRQSIKYKALLKLVEEGQVSREGKGGKGDPFKYGCTLVPEYIGVQAKQNPENGQNPYGCSANGCTQVFAENQESEKSRVQAFSPNEDGVIDLRNTACEVVE